MKIKKCIGCGKELPIDDFYRHPKTSDGHVGRCIECTKKNVRENRLKKLEYYREFDRQRADLPKRVKARKEYAEKMKESPDKTVKSAVYLKRYRRKYPEKYKAHNNIEYAINSNKVVKPEVCSVCGKKRKLEGHHYDYSKPLEVVWVCHICHMKIHKELRELERQSNS